MRIKLMKTIDRYLGQLLCFLVSLSHPQVRKIPSYIRDVLIIKMFGLGTIVLMTPMVRALREANGDINIHFLTFEENQSIVKSYGISNHVYCVRRTSMVLFVLDTFNVIRVLRRLRFSVIIDGEFFSRYTALVAFLLKSDFRTGFFNRNIYRGDMLDFRAHFNPYRHIIRSFLDLVSAFLKAEASLEIDKPKVPYTATFNIKKKFKEIDIHDPNRLIVLLNPNTSNISKGIDRSWPLENFVAFGDLCRAKGFQVIFVGGPEDAQRTRGAVQMSGDGVISIAGRTTIDETLALMRYSFLLVTNDSGPLHMAVSVGLPTISFFGTESPLIYGPTSGLNVFFWKRLACSPCLSVTNFKRSRCDFNSKCLRDISLGEVVDLFEASEEKLVADYRKRVCANHDDSLER